jgi:predicted MFS family arabinose efflux permease
MVAGDIWTIIAARTLQGAGAISSVAMALAADLTREQHRTKVMAMIGSTIGLMFALSLVGAPLLYRAIGLEGLFALNAILCLAAMAVVKYYVPEPASPQPAARAAGSLRAAVLDAELVRLNLGIFVLHIVLYAMFVVVPPLLVQEGLPLPEHWKLYLPVVLGSFVLMVPAVLYADRRNGSRPVLLGAVLLLLAAEAALAAFGGGMAMLAALMLVFFVAFNVLEALLPSLVSRIAPARGRGAAIGVYNTTQTLGVFFGGLVGGSVAAAFGTTGVFAVCAALALLWLAVAAGMRRPPAPVNELSSLTFSIASGVSLDGLHEALARVHGVREAEIVAAERIARLKVVPGQWDEHRVRKLITGEV